MSKEAHKKLQEAMDERSRRLGEATKVHLVMNLSQAVAARVVLQQFLSDYIGEKDDLAKHIERVIDIIQEGLDNC